MTELVRHIRMASAIRDSFRIGGHLAVIATLPDGSVEIVAWVRLAMSRGPLDGHRPHKRLGLYSVREAEFLVDFRVMRERRIVLPTTILSLAGLSDAATVVAFFVIPGGI